MRATLALALPGGTTLKEMRDKQPPEAQQRIDQILANVAKAQ